MYQAQKKANPQPVEIRKIGIGEVSVFSGFCPTHDHDLFEQIDRGKVVSNSENQVALMFLRSIAWEFAQKRKIHAYYSTLLDKVGSIVAPERAMFMDSMREGVRHFIESDAPYYFELCFDALRSNSYKDWEYAWAEIPQNIGLSTATVFSPLQEEHNEHMARTYPEPQPLCSFTIFPLSGKTHIVSSWAKKDHGHCQWIQQAYGKHDSLVHFVNKCAFTESEDTCMRPSLWEALNAEQQAFVLNGMRHEMFRGALDEILLIVAWEHPN